jgi:hypothetical protein
MSALRDVLAERGVTVTEAELADIARQNLAGGLFDPRSTALPGEESAIYAAAGMVGDIDAYRHQVIDNVLDYARLVSESEPVVDAASRLGVNRSRIQQMITSRAVWAIQDARGRWVLPCVQFADGDVLPGWSTVARALPAGLHPLEIIGFLTTPQPELGIGGRARTVLDWLRTGGDATEAARLAAGLADIGA